METYPFESFEKYLAPFSGHMLEYKGTLYTTTEHAYHCQRFTNPPVLKEIMDARSAFRAWEIAQQYKHTQRSDWDEVKATVMEELFRAKLGQHRDVREALIQSGDATIVKHQADPFWGDGLDGKGKNEMGKIWMKLRSELQ